MKITAKEFNLSTFQVSVFVRSSTLMTQSKLLTPILTKYNSLFNGDVTAFPVPSDAPAEIPRVIISSLDNTWKVQSSLNRIDCFWVNVGQEHKKENILRQAIDILLHIIELSKLSIGRSALVVNRYLERPTAAKDLSAHFCNERILKEPIKHSDNFEIHNHKKYDLKIGDHSITINSWIRCKTSELLINKKPAILVEHDLNTIQETIEKEEISIDHLKKFFKAADIEIDKILELYFPSN